MDNYFEKSLVGLYLMCGFCHFKVESLNYIGYGSAVGPAVCEGLIEVDERGCVAFTQIGLEVARLASYRAGLHLGMRHILEHTYDASRIPAAFHEGYVDAADCSEPGYRYGRPLHVAHFAVTSQFDASNPLH